MKIDAIIIKDKKAKVYFGYLRNFPGICAQANSLDELNNKLDRYFEKFIETIKGKHVEMDENVIEIA